ncbi:MAG: HAD-IC family P-type ATPase [Dehalococcoidia bacterium]
MAERAQAAAPRGVTTPASSGRPLDPDLARLLGRERGLSEAEAARRTAAGLANTDPSREVRDRDVVRRNTVTFFNLTLLALIGALLIVGEVRDGLFVGIVVGANVVVATIEELVATRRLRSLQALTAPGATVVRDRVTREVAAVEVVQGDVLVLAPGRQVVADGHLLGGACELDEALLTGESSTIRRAEGEAVRSGSYCVAGAAVYVAEEVGARAYAHQLTAQARERVRHETPLMIQFRRLLRVLLTATGVLAALLFIQFNIQDRGFAESLKATTATVTTVVPVGMLLGITVVTAVGALRVSRAGAIVQDMHAVEALNYVDVIAFDKTGTITSNRLEVRDVVWAENAAGEAPWLAAFSAAAREESRTVGAIAAALASAGAEATVVGRVPFSSARRWSALELERGGVRRVFVLGAPEAVLAGLPPEAALVSRYAEASAGGLRGVAFAEADALPSDAGALPRLRPLGLVILADELRAEVADAFALMRTLAIAPRVISGDHPDTVAALLKQVGVTPAGAPRSGVDLEALSDADLAAVVEATTVFGRVTPELKARIVEALIARDHFVAMVGDGVNDVQALRAADVGVAMASGAPITRGVAGIVLLDDSFAALIRGTREATFVLGNVGRLSKLFLAKSVYAFLLILATNLLGLEFPFLPRQGGVMSALTLGIPAVFVAIGTPPKAPTRGFARDVLRFALPAGVALAVSAILLQFATEGLLARTIEEARTLVSITIVVVGVAFVVEVLGFEGVNWQRPWRPILSIGLAAILLAALAVIVSQESLREFFAFTPVSRVGWAGVGVASAAALAAQYLLSRHWQRGLDILTAKPRARDRSRGKAL